MTLRHVKNLSLHVMRLNTTYRRKHQNFDKQFGIRMIGVMQAIVKEAKVPQEEGINLPMGTPLGEESGRLFEETKQWLDQILLA